MKKLIAIAFFAVLSSSITAQTKLDSLIFNKINEYRVSNGLTKIIMVNDAYLISKVISDTLSSTAYDNNYMVAMSEFNKSEISKKSSVYGNASIAYIVDTAFTTIVNRNNDSNMIVNNIRTYTYKESVNISDEVLADKIVSFWITPWSYMNGSNSNWITAKNIKYAAVSVSSGNNYAQHVYDDMFSPYITVNNWVANIKFVSFTCYK